MRVLVLGAGVVGTTSAWYLAGAGHQVTVLDRQPLAGIPPGRLAVVSVGVGAGGGECL